MQLELKLQKFISLQQTSGCLHCIFSQANVWRSFDFSKVKIVGLGGIKHEKKQGEIGENPW